MPVTKHRRVQVCWSCLLQGHKGEILLVMPVTNTEGSRSAGHACYKDTKVQVLLVVIVSKSVQCMLVMIFAKLVQGLLLVIVTK